MRYKACVGVSKVNVPALVRGTLSAISKSWQSYEGTVSLSEVIDNDLVRRVAEVHFKVCNGNIKCDFVKIAESCKSLHRLVAVEVCYAKV